MLYNQINMYYSLEVSAMEKSNIAIRLRQFLKICDTRFNVEKNCGNVKGIL